MRPSDFFDRIAAEHDPMIRRIATSYEAHPHLAQELVQEIYFAIWRALPSFRGQASLKTFVATIATNRAVSHVARAVRTPRTVELDEQMPSPDEDPERLLFERDRRESLLAAMRTLPLSLRQTALLVVEGLSTAEISSVLGITVNAVAVRMSRAREFLRKQLENTHE